jgi:shikimate kinase
MVMTGPRDIQNLALIGFMGTGKSTVGRFVASQLHFKFVDTDELIEARAGRTISEIFTQAGEAAFRNIEAQVVEELGHAQQMVIATGGGLGANEVHLGNLKRHALVVCLWASPQVIWDRVREQSHRPLLQGADPMARMRELLAERERAYKQADVLVNTEMRSIKEVAHHVLHQFHLARQSSPR